MNLFEIKSSLYELLENGYNAECVDERTGEFDEAKAKALLDGAVISGATLEEKQNIQIK